MGWDTTVVVLAEDVDNTAVLSATLHDLDSRDYRHVTSFEKPGVLCHAYERRKFAPYWVIEEISKTYPDVKFTLLSSDLDLCGPGGIVRITNGEKADSYTFLDGRQELVKGHHTERLYRWFRYGGLEEAVRLDHVKEFPLYWRDIDDCWAAIAPYEVTPQIEHLNRIVSEAPEAYGWKEMRIL